MADSFRQAEAQRVLLHKGRVIAGVSPGRVAGSASWDPTATVDAASVTSKIGTQYTAPFPNNEEAPVPRGVVCPTQTGATSTIFSRSDRATVPALQDPPARQKRFVPKNSDLGLGFGGTAAVAPVPTSAVELDQSAVTAASLAVSGPSTADQFIIDPEPGVTQPARQFRPYQSCDTSYLAQW